MALYGGRTNRRERLAGLHSKMQEENIRLAGILGPATAGVGGILALSELAGWMGPDRSFSAAYLFCFVALFLAGTKIVLFREVVRRRIAAGAWRIPGGFASFRLDAVLVLSICGGLFVLDIQNLDDFSAWVMGVLLVSFFIRLPAKEHGVIFGMVALWIFFVHLSIGGIATRPTQLVVFSFIAILGILLVDTLQKSLMYRYVSQRLLRKKLSELNRLSYTDPLTGIGNRRYFDQLLAREIKNRQRVPADGCLMIIDLDHFKRVNDTHGHLVGDEVLVAFCDLTKRCIRDNDIFARIGGEEFAIFTQYAKIPGALQVAKRIQAELSRQPLTPKVGILTASIGLTSVSGEDSLEQIYSEADSRLYQAKQAGRNRIVHSGEVH